MPTSASCTATTDAQGLAQCAIDPGLSGEIYVVATTTDREAIRLLRLRGKNYSGRKGRVGGPAKIASAEETRRVILKKVAQVKRVQAWEEAGGSIHGEGAGKARSRGRGND